MTALGTDGYSVFSEAAEAGMLVVRRCRACSGWAAPYSLRGVAYRDCPACHEAGLGWEAVGGEATLVTWTFVPETVAGSGDGRMSGVVEIREGPWLACAIDVPVERLAVQMELRVGFTKTGDGTLIPTARAPET